MFELHEKSHPSKAEFRSPEDGILFKWDVLWRNVLYVTSGEDYFWYNHDNTHAQTQQTNSIFWEVILGTFFRKKIEETTKLQNTGLKQHFTSTSKILDDLIIRLENFKALMEFKVKYFDVDKNTQ